MINDLAQGQNTVCSVRLKPATPRCQVKHSIIEPLHSWFVNCSSKLYISMCSLFYNWKFPATGLEKSTCLLACRVSNAVGQVEILTVSNVKY